MMALVRLKSGSGQFRESYAHRSRALIALMARIESREVSNLKKVLAALLFRARFNNNTILDDVPSKFKAKILAVAVRLRNILYVEQIPQISRQHIPKTFNDHFLKLIVGCGFGRESKIFRDYFGRLSYNFLEVNPSYLITEWSSLAKKYYWLGCIGRDLIGHEIILYSLKNNYIVPIYFSRYSVLGSLQASTGQVFNLDYTALSRAFKIFNAHLLHHHRQLLTNNLKFWVPYFPMFAPI